jgi:ribosomal protein S18 acetylase RimI-like enzyme
MSISICNFENAVHRGQVIALWELVFGYATAHNEPGLCIDKKLAVNDGLLFVAVEGEVVVGTVMAGYDGHRGWIYSLAVSPAHRRQGIGSRLVAHAEEALRDRGCLKINLQVLEGNESALAFYERMGFAVEKRFSMGKVV